MIAALGVILTYLGSSIALFLAIARLLNVVPERTVHAFMLVAGAGPMIIAWLMAIILWLCPGYSNLFYLTSVTGVIVCMAAYGSPRWRVLGVLASQCKRIAQRLPREMLRLEGLLLVGLLIALGLVCFLAVFLPVMENDALQYLYVAAQMYERKSTAFYPLIETDKTTGFYAISSHPIAYYALMVWSYLLQGTADAPGLTKLIAPAYMLYTLGLVAWLTRAYGRVAVYSSCLFVVLSFIYASQVAQLSIDSLRMYFLLLSLAWLLEMLRRPDLRVCAVAGAITGLSMFSHSLGGLISFPFVAVAYLLMSAEPLRSSVKCLIVAGIAAFLFGGARYLSNIVLFGTPFYDTIPIYQMVDGLDRDTWVSYTHSFNTWRGLLLYGALQNFVLIKIHGPAFLLFLAVWVWQPRRVWQDLILRACLLFQAFFFLMVWLMVLLQINVLIESFRYMMTPLPFAAIGAGYLMSTLYGRVHAAN